MKRSARVTLHPKALQHNLQQARLAAPHSKVLAVIKANAYGHGVLEVAQALQAADGYAVSCIPEAIALRESGTQHPILILQGHQNYSLGFFHLKSLSLELLPQAEFQAEKLQ